MTTDVPRCPYCVEDHLFKPLQAIEEDLYPCPRCGHKEVASDPSYKCRCRKCSEMSRLTGR